MEKTLKVEYQVAEKSTIIDPVTTDHLELLAPRAQKKSKVTLFGLLNQCSSEPGVRLLRSNLFQPPREVNLINDRLELLEELVNDVNKYSSIRSIITRMPELDSILRYGWDQEHFLNVILYFLCLVSASRDQK